MANGEKSFKYWRVAVRPAGVARTIEWQEVRVPYDGAEPPTLIVMDIAKGKTSVEFMPAGEWIEPDGLNCFGHFLVVLRGHLQVSAGGTILDFNIGELIYFGDDLAIGEYKMRAVTDVTLLEIQLEHYGLAGET